MISGHLMVTIDSFFMPFTGKKTAHPSHLLPEERMITSLLKKILRPYLDRNSGKFVSYVSYITAIFNSYCVHLFVI